MYAKSLQNNSGKELDLPPNYSGSTFRRQGRSFPHYQHPPVPQPTREYPRKEDQYNSTEYSRFASPPRHISPPTYTDESYNDLSDTSTTENDFIEPMEDIEVQGSCTSEDCKDETSPCFSSERCGEQCTPHSASEHKRPLFQGLQNPFTSLGSEELMLLALILLLSDSEKGGELSILLLILLFIK